jgi:hypothetical protein
MPRGPYDVFISYRRGEGSDLAHGVREALMRHGFRVFLDVTGLDSGPFNPQLLKHIQKATDFVLILTPGSLDGCGKEDDWLRTEIVHAIQTGRNVVPVLRGGFDFKALDTLPRALQRLADYQAVDQVHHDDAIRNLLSKVKSRTRARLRRLFTRFAPAVLAFAVGWALASVGGVNSLPPPKPQPDSKFGGQPARTPAPTSPGVVEDASPVFTNRRDAVFSWPKGHVPHGSRAESPDGRHYALEIEPFDEGNIGVFTISGERVQHWRLLPPATKNDLKALAWNPGADRVAVMYHGGNVPPIQIVELGKSTPVAVARPEGLYHLMVFSRDGKTLLLAKDPDGELRRVQPSVAADS